MSDKNPHSSDYAPAGAGEFVSPRGTGSGALTSPVSAGSLPSPVDLRGRSQKPLVLGKEVRRLTKPQYDVVQVLRDAGETGLSKGELHRKSGHVEPQKILKRLRKSDALWAAVIEMAGSPGLGYRIINPRGATT